MPSSDAGVERQRIWDLPLRLCHWGLVASVSGSFASHYAGASAFGWHVRFGYLTLALTLFRVGWGGLGPRYARFAELARRPRARGAGHTVLGGWMALALVALLLAQALAGLGANDELLNSGPLSGWVGRQWSDALSSAHVMISAALWLLIAVHVAAALYYRWWRSDDRITPLVTGYKRGVPAGSAIESDRLGRALALIVVIALALWLVSVLAPAPLELLD